MRKLLITLVLLTFLDFIIFADDNIITNNILKIIENNLEKTNMKTFGVSIIPELLNNLYDENNIQIMGYISININFNTGMYRLRDNFNNIIENIILTELKRLYPNYSINISTYYPFNILFTNNQNLDIEERHNILNEIIKNNRNGIDVEHIFHNSLYGYFRDNSFSNLSGDRNIVNRLLHNNFIIFIDQINMYFNIVNIGF